MTIVEETDFSSKISELTSTLDQVKKYKELARSLVDFALIMLASIIAILFVYIGMDVYRAQGGQIPANIILSGVEVIVAAVILGAGFIAGLLWVERRIGRVKVGEWKSFQKEGTLGAVKILSELDWPTVFQDIRYSKLGFVMYSILKIVCYWILADFLLFFVIGFPLYYMHTQLNNYSLGFISLILVLVLNRKDLQRRYNQSWALDSLVWELRWFDSEFRGKAEFGKARG